MDTLMLEQACKEISKLKGDKVLLMEALKELLHEYTTTDFDFVGLNPKLIEKCKNYENKGIRT